MGVKNKTKIYTIIALFLLLSIVMIVFLVYPALKDIKKTSKEIVSNREGLKFIEVQNTELENFKKNYKNYEPNLKKIDQLFIDPNNPVSFIKFLEKTALDLNIDPEINLSYQFSQEDLKNQAKTEFQIFTKGSFSNILRFSEKIENGPYLVKIKSLTMGKSEGSNNLVEANFLIEVTNNQ